MPLFDLSLEALRTYAPDVACPSDFASFWEATLTDARRAARPTRFDRVDDVIYHGVEAFDVTFTGFAGQPIKGWLIQPRAAADRRPAVVSYIGYGGGRSLPIDHLAPAAAGFVHFVMDTRGQGSGWSPGDTPDDAGSGPQHPGFMTRGIESRDTYYYRRLITDAARAVEAVAEWPGVDAERIAVRGGSQGGGLAIAAAGLLRERVAACVADVPFLCHFRRAIELTDRQPYSEIRSYLAIHRSRVEQVLTTLSYVDGVNFAGRITAPALFSAGLMDLVCPPSTVFAAYNRVTSRKSIVTYTYNEHEGGGVFQAAAALRYLCEMLKP